MYEKQEQKKIRMEALLKKMDIVLKVNMNSLHHIPKS